MSFEDIAPLSEVERLRIENACCHEEIERLRAALRDLLDASERHIFSTECQVERDAARAALEERT